MGDARRMTHTAHRKPLASIYGVPMAPDDRGKAFAELIVEARRRKGWRQDDLVEASGVSRRLITRWEGGDASRPDPDKVRAVCLALGVDPRRAAIALGYLSPEDVGPAVNQPQPLSPEEEEILAILRDPQVPSAEKAPLLDYLRFLRDQRRNPRQVG